MASVTVIANRLQGCGAGQISTMKCTTSAAYLTVKTLMKTTVLMIG
jgi:hypothetical protein